MTRRSQSPADRAVAPDSYSREFLERLARILVRSGHSPEALTREFAEICAGLKVPRRRWDPRQLGYFHDLPHVLTRWHADPEYLDARGVPLALPLRARGSSLFSLIGSVLPGEDPAGVVRVLLRLRGIRRRKARYVPNGRSLVYSQEVGRIHALSALRGMLRTVEHNLSHPKHLALLEQVAMNPSLPLSALPALQRRLKAVAGDFLWTADGGMRRHEDEDVEGPRARVGVGAYVYVEPIRPRAASRPSSTVGSTRRRGARRKPVR